jgi:small-conductance mechanosensitive channel
MKKLIKKIGLSVLIISFISASFLMVMHICVKAQDTEGVAPADVSNEAAAQERIVKETIEEAEEAKSEAESAKKELEVHKKAVEIEKKKAEVKIKEAVAAKKEAQLLKDLAATKKEVAQAVETARQKEKEARAAQEKVGIAEEKMRVAQDTAKIAEEELRLAQQRAAIAEAKVRSRYTIMQKRAIQTLIVVIIGYFLIFLFARIINWRIKDVKSRHIIRKNMVYFITIAIILAIFFVWSRNINSITIFLSVIGAGVALALQEVLLCMAGWFLIMVRRPFEVGDRIEMGGVKGDVIDIRLFQTSLLEIGNWVDADQSTGRIVNIPNSEIYKKENYNYSRGFEFIWNEIKIMMTFESDWKKAEAIMNKHGIEEVKDLEKIVKKKIDAMARHYMIYYEHLTPIVYVNIKDSGVELTLRYLTEAQRRRMTQDKLCRAILDDFAKEKDVNFAYTTYRIVK